MNNLCVVILLVILLLSIYIFFYPVQTNEHAVSQPLYKLTSQGLNLPHRDGSYLGAMQALSDVENADRVDKIRPE